LFEPNYEGKGQPDSLVVFVPEWPEIKILADVLNQTTYVLGSDYFGECKKANLRMAMYLIKQQDGLGLHAGSKLIRIKDKNNSLTEKGIILFGLSGTGKTTLTIHNHYLTGPERVFILQDDVILMDKQAACYGTENNYYIKTEGLEPSQEILYTAAIQPEAVMENVGVDPASGKVDFTNYDLTTNGREIVLRKDIPLCTDIVDLAKANIIIFITRRNDIVHPVAKLNPVQGAAFFMLGESIETSAGDPTKAGQSKREVGFNPFIIGSKGQEGNRFLEILKNNPDINCYLLNTGVVGNTDKISIKDSVSMLTEIARNNIDWQANDDWGYQVPVEVAGVDSKKLNPANYFAKEEYNKLVDNLKQERLNWLNQFEDLDPGIKKVFS
ncbi:MAG TPA: phosphoenolpyruvate carboxykinase, partial [Patescibacteria group bacterium]